MPRRTTFTVGRLSARTDTPRAIRTAKRSTPPHRKTRSQTVSNPTPPFAPSPPLTDPGRTRGQKRKASSQDDRPDKRLQNNLQFASVSGPSLSDHTVQKNRPAKQLPDSRQFPSESSQPLTKENLATLDRLTGSIPSDKMDHTITTPEKGGRKRLSSRQSNTADFSQGMTSSQSQKSSGSYARYRWVVLDKARLYVCTKPPPEDIQTRINTVVQKETAKGRKEELAAIGEQLCNEFVAVLNAASREDDSVELIHRALSSMDKDQKFGFPRKIDWNPTLKPEVEQFYWRFPLMGRSNDNADEPIASPGKRRQLNTPNPLEGPQSTMPPPPSPLLQPRQDNSILKTPRPDITMGLRHSTLVESLVVEGVDGIHADAFLKILQEQQTICSDPSQEATNIRFPLLVVEGKSYSTGRFVFEAQNQAAVSGSCMMKMQHQLADLFDSSASGSHEKKEPLAFSICTEGPHMELWVHYTTSVGGRRNYNMNLLQTCHALLPAGVVDFLVVVDRVLSWACSEFVDDVAKQLALIEDSTRQHTV